MARASSIASAWVGTVPAATDERALPDRFRRAAGLMAAADTGELIGSALGGGPVAGRVAALVGGVDHVGFMAPPFPSLVPLGAAAEAAGFDGRHHTLASAILSRELGARLGAGPLPTTIFKASGAAEDGSAIAVEVAMPAAFGRPDVLRAWLAEDVGSHLALTLAPEATFAEIGALMEGAGYRMPAFFGGAPLHNAEEGLTACYFDGHVGVLPVRLEFCRY